MRRPFIAGNWKMNMTHLEAISFIQNLGCEFKNKNDCEVCVCPPFTALGSIKNIIDNDRLELKLGTQNMHWEDSGAYTGEVSPLMLKAFDVDYVIIGHSERREYFADTNETVNKKIRAAFKYGLKPIMCIGEKIEIREAGNAIEFVIGQLVKCLEGIEEGFISSLTIAYEPIWAIGTGRTATSGDANEMCASIRKKISELYSISSAGIIRILYGGSVKASNISELMSMPDINGALVGGASIDLKEFIGIINFL
ncbi:MAG: triose-phosphate isomerase [Actinobacteria bacterium]|nr:triose-phosphate isomerase [Actinomycetota bacterium]MBM3712612.1 triose-phosphate isomerase [Actinomycetota bacterium]